MDRQVPSPTSGPIVPAPRSSAVGYRLARATLGRVVRLLYPLQVDGLDRVPERGPVILAANHRSFMDSIFLTLASPRPISFLAKAEYFQHRLTRWLFTGTGQIPLRRGSPVAARRALAAASDVLEHDGVVGIYPEGTRSRDGNLHRGHQGPAVLALEANAPVVPVGLIGTDAVQHPGQRLPRPFKPIRVRYGQARQIAADNIENNRTARLREFTSTVMRDIAALSGQTYVDRYAPTSMAR